MAYVICSLSKVTFQSFKLFLIPRLQTSQFEEKSVQKNLPVYNVYSIFISERLNNFPSGSHIL